MTMDTPTLPAGVMVLERGWLSANNVLMLDPEGATLVDSGYSSHANQTLALVAAALGQTPLRQLLNTHLHSDHCGGNAALQTRHPGLQTWIPPGEAAAVERWDEDALSYRATGQSCPRFRFSGVLEPGRTLTLAGLPWQVLAAPGHDPHAVLLFQPEYRVLISGDALWENGFGVVFPELDGEQAFHEVEATLDLIEALRPLTVIPGHGPVFGGTEAAVAQALARARSRLAQFRAQPMQHARYAAKVLLKFKLMECQDIAMGDFLVWARQTPCLQGLHAAMAVPGSVTLERWLRSRLADLQNAGAAVLDGERLRDG